MVTFSLPKESRWLVDLRCLLSGRSGLQFASLLWPFTRFAKLLFSFSDVLKATNCTFQEVDTIFCPAVAIAVYDEFFSCMCAAEFLCALDVFARHTSSRITSLTLTIVGRSRGDVSSHQDIFQIYI